MTFTKVTKKEYSNIPNQFFGSYTEALAFCDKTITINQNDAEAWNNRGVVLGNLGRYSEEVASYDRAIAINPNYYEAWNNKGTALVNFGKHQDAIGCYDNALVMKPIFYVAWDNKGKVYYLLNDFENAAKAFRNSLSLNPKNAETWYFRGRSLILSLNFPEGIKSFDNALTINPNPPDFKKYKNLALEKLDSLIRTSNSIEELLWKNAAVIKKDCPQLTPLERVQAVLKSATQLGDGLNCVSNLEQNNIIKWNFNSLLRDFKRYQSLQQTLTDEQKECIITAKNYFDNGFIYGFLGYHHESIKAIDAGLKKFSNDENAWNNKGVALGHIGKITEAKRIFDRIILLHPQKIESIMNLCWILNQDENYDEILRLCDIIIKIDPNNSIAKQIKQITATNISVKNKSG